MLWSALQIILLVYLGVAALIYFRQSSLVFLPEIDRGFRASPADIGFPANRIVLFGESLGGGMAAPLAAENRPAALVPASTFTSVPDLKSGLYPLLPIRLLARIRYDTVARLSRVACPVLVIHSRNDDIIPFVHGQRLFAAAHPPKQFLEIEGDHNAGFVFGRDDWVRKLDGFLAQALP